MLYLFSCFLLYWAAGLFAMELFDFCAFLMLLNFGSGIEAGSLCLIKENKQDSLRSQQARETKLVQKLLIISISRNNPGFNHTVLMIISLNNGLVTQDWNFIRLTTRTYRLHHVYSRKFECSIESLIIRINGCTVHGMLCKSLKRCLILHWLWWKPDCAT